MFVAVNAHTSVSLTSLLFSSYLMLVRGFRKSKQKSTNFSGTQDTQEYVLQASTDIERRTHNATECPVLRTPAVNANAHR